MPLRNLIRKELVSAEPGASVLEVAQLMREKDVGAVLVVDQGRPMGIITDRDIVLRCVCEQDDCNALCVSQVMTRALETVSVSEGLYDVAEKMRTKEIRRIPVVDERGRAVGLVSFGDILELLTKELGNVASAARPDHKKIVTGVA